jgi:hypothetical protein
VLCEREERTKGEKVLTPLIINSCLPRFIIIINEEKVMAQAMRCFENLMRFNHAIIMLNECDLV